MCLFMKSVVLLFLLYMIFYRIYNIHISNVFRIEFIIIHRVVLLFNNGDNILNFNKTDKTICVFIQMLKILYHIR